MIGPSDRIKDAAWGMMVKMGILFGDKELDIAEAALDKMLREREFREYLEKRKRMESLKP